MLHKSLPFIQNKPSGIHKLIYDHLPFLNFSSSSSFNECPYFSISTASLTFLFMQYSSIVINFAFCIQMSWEVLCKCFTRADSEALSFDISVACSFNQIFNDVPVSPIQTKPHKQGIEYIPFCCLGSIKSFTESTKLLMVFGRLKGTIMLYFFMTLTILSAVTLMYSNKIFGISTVCWVCLLSCV